MRARARVVLALPGVVLALLWLGGALACAQRAPERALYQWTDTDGNVRYTPHRQRIPLDQRASAQPVVAAPEDTHGQYWTEAPPERPREPQPPAPPLEAPSAEAAPAPVESGPPEVVRGEAQVRPAAPPSPRTESPEQRMRRLEAEIAADRETLKRLISAPEAADGLRDSPELREISERLPRLQAELEALRAEPESAQGDGG